MGSCNVCCSCTGGKICEHRRAQSCRCWQNPPATFQTGKEHLCCTSGVSFVVVHLANSESIGLEGENMQLFVYNRDQRKYKLLLERSLVDLVVTDAPRRLALLFSISHEYYTCCRFKQLLKSESCLTAMGLIH